MADDHQGPEKIADVLGRLFTSRGWGRKNDRMRLEAAWTDAAGEHIARTRGCWASGAACWRSRSRTRC